MCGWPQSAQRAEVAAFLSFLQVVWTPTLLFSDSQYTVDRANVIMANRNVLPTEASLDRWSHFDLWQDIVVLMAEKAHLYMLQWHPGHLEECDLLNGLGNHQATLLNAGADLLAKAGAASHLPSLGIVADARRMQVARVLHEMAISIFHTRHKASPMPGRCPGEADRNIILAAQGDAYLSADAIEHLHNLESSEQLSQLSSDSEDEFLCNL